VNANLMSFVFTRRTVLPSLASSARRFLATRRSDSQFHMTDPPFVYASRFSLFCHRVRTEPVFLSRALLLLGASVAGLVYAYQHTFTDTVPVSGRKRVLNFPVSVETMIGRTTFESMAAEYSKSGVLLPVEHRHFVRVHRVLKALLAAVPELVGPIDEWSFMVVQSRDVNAFALPGGRVVVNSGLLDFATTDDELAVVLSHEIAHVIARHGAEKMTGVAVGRLLRFAVGRFISSEDVWNAFFTLTRELPQSRQLESEADLIGIFVAAKAGVCPNWAPVFWHKMMQQTKENEFMWLSTHPPSAQRAAELAQVAPKAMPLYLSQRKRLTWFEAYFTATFQSCDACPK